MYSNFTGTSRRPRNVNLSGQAHDPFARLGWPSAASGTAKTVTQAAVERQQRQHERQRKKAAITIQKAWRAYKHHTDLANFKRSQLENVYSSRPGVNVDASSRILEALPLIVQSFRVTEPVSLRHLDQLANDVRSVGLPAFVQLLAQTRHDFVKGLAGHVVVALEHLNLPLVNTDLLMVLVGALQVDSTAIYPIVSRYYSLMARLGQDQATVDSSGLNLRMAVALPLKPTGKGCSERLMQSVYESFAFSFLTTPRLLVIEEEPSCVFDTMNFSLLSSIIVASLRRPQRKKQNRIPVLWLFAHSLALGVNVPGSAAAVSYVQAMTAMLYDLSNDIRRAFRKNDNTGSGVLGEVRAVFPSYVAGQIQQLVSSEGISNLLQQFNVISSLEKSSTVEECGNLSGFILALLQVFPSKGDDILMKLFWEDVHTTAGRLPLLHILWKAVGYTSIYQDVWSEKSTAVELILRAQQARAKSASSALPQEWKVILLFLELYVFLLRVTDDDDFFSVVNEPAIQEHDQDSRVRRSNLGLDDVKELTIFLKNLTLSLYYNSGDLFASKSSISGASLSVFNATGDTTTSGPSLKQQYAILTTLLGSSFHVFRETATTALKMLYERDSRRPFVPHDHWLMTAKFDMTGFVAAVVAEHDRQETSGMEGNDENDESSDQESDTDDEDDVENSMALHSSSVRLVTGRERTQHLRRPTLSSVVRPKLEVLRNMPFVIPFETRLRIFRQFIDFDKMKRDAAHPHRSMMHLEFGHPRNVAVIRRGQVFEDAYFHLYRLGSDLKDPVSITFVDQFGQNEPGIDGGGVTKEFLISVMSEVFATNDDDPLFVFNAQNLSYPSPSIIDTRINILQTAGHSLDSEECRNAVLELCRRYEFIGRLVGKCIYVGTLIDVEFARFFLRKWACSSAPGQSTAHEGGYRPNVNDLREMDEELYQGLMRLKNYDGDFSDLAVDFTILDPISPPSERPIRTVTRELVPGGAEKAVTKQNRPLYIWYVARHRLVSQPRLQTTAFLRGLCSIIEPWWLAMFNQNELQRLVGGDAASIDVEDLRRNTHYSGVYVVGDDGEEHLTVKLFWEAMRQMSDAERRDVVKYVTSAPRAPLLGFSQLNPRFTIRDASQDENRLPSASTCVNLLKLPQYRTMARLKEKVLYAAQSGAGFDLS